ncbi:MAG: signal recognition particle protein [Anaerolineales bacterium]|nr:signal recognition particle protein [Anaerolineales bacterium]
MFDQLTKRLDEIFHSLKRKGKLSEKDVEIATREIRLALLDADVHYGVVRDFVSQVKERAVGQEVSKALNPGQQVVKIVHEELIQTLGEPAPLKTAASQPLVIMLTGLQGSGKTTAAGKIARLLKKQGENVLLIAADPYRPAAVDQLQSLGDQLSIPVFSDQSLKPPQLAKEALRQAQLSGSTVVILDTAGRSQIDEDLMEELGAVQEACSPDEILLVVDAMIGQEAVNVAEGFIEAGPITGLIMSKMDGDARGGAAISIRSVTGVPIKFLGTGEGLEALETYDPARLASRILGMGDVIGLIERAEETIDEETARQQTERLLSGEFTLEDFSQQISQVMKMGSIGKLMGMLPGEFGKMSQSVDPQEAEKKVRTSQAVIQSMTPAERQNPKILNASRRKRIAAGSGTQVYDVNQLMKQYRDAQKLFKQLKKSGLGNMPRFS